MRDDILRERERKLEAYARIAEPYPATAKRGKMLGAILADFKKYAKAKKPILAVGRIFAWRDQGGIIFADVRDGSGGLQFVFNEKELKNFKPIKDTFDAGDFIEVQGIPFMTQRGEKSLLVRSARILTKSLRPIPATWYGLSDIETRLRKRYLDMMVHPEVRELFVKKNMFWNEVRGFLKRADFLGVETPVLEPVPGGAEAEPFVTHHNALGRDFYLRISLELPLKRLLVGGFEKVFEIGRIFRNEGIDREHLQDYTQMECYWAYADYEDMMKFTEAMYKVVIKKTCGTLKVTSGGQTVDWSKKWRKVDYYDAFKKHAGIDLKSVTYDDLFREAKKINLAPEKNFGKGRLIDLIYKKKVRPTLLEPSFLVDPPVEIEPLAKRLVRDPNRVARFQIMAWGTELGKGFSELNDPRDQRKRFEEQMKLREAGDTEAQRIDEDFVEALEYGMPPAAGFGMSERLFAVLMDRPIRETVIFPLMREE